VRSKEESVILSSELDYKRNKNWIIIKDTFSFREIFIYPGIIIINRIRLDGLICDFKKFLTIEHVPRIIDFCICIYMCLDAS